MAKISVSVIMKNEEANIPAFMAGVLLFADEIVINDTGSTDNSVAIADTYPKVKIFETEWKDGFHFGKARNQSISTCTGDWIIWLDLDDRVDVNFARSVRAIAENADKSDVFLFNVKCTNIKTPETIDVIQTRMFHKDSGIRFDRAIHESCENSILANKLNKRYVHEVSLVHIGYENDKLLKKKALRNLDLLEKEEEGIEKYQHTAVTLATLKRYNEANDAFIKAYCYSTTDEQKDMVATSALNILIEKKDIFRIDNWLDLLCKDTKEVLYYKAEAALVKGENLKARELFREFLAKEKSGSQLIPFSERMNMRAKLIINIMDNVDKKRVA